MDRQTLTRTRMSEDEYVEDYLDRHDAFESPTEAQIAAAKEERRELQDEKLRADGEEARGDWEIVRSQERWYEDERDY